MARRIVAALAALCCLLALRATARAEGALVVRDANGERATLPLTRTSVDAEVGGSVTSVTVTQRFHNGFSHPIEAVYVFPLPDDAAVDAMEMHIGPRVLRAVIARRADARQRYEEARDQGRRAALLEQERPNIFTFNVANIDPGADIDVRLHFFGTARYDDHTYTWAFPMVVGPRYIPGTPLPTAPSGTGTQPDTDRVRDASRISPAYVPPGVRSGHAVSLRVHLDAGSELEHVEAVAHDVTLVQTSTSVVEVALRDKDEIPNRDFILRWRLQAPSLRASLRAHRPAVQGDGYLALSLEPRHDAPPTETAAREFFFLLDTSGSMQGPALDAVKGAITRALGGMREDDTFQIIDFADSASSFAPRPLAPTADNLARAAQYLQSLQASGGTNQLAGIHAALTAPGDAMRLRYVVFMTDGYIGNESEVIALTRRELGRARIFSFGVGSSVNRYLLDEVALAGRGAAEFLRQDEDPEAVIARFYTRVARPYLTDVTIDWGNLPVRDAQPMVLPDVSSLSPLVVYARYAHGAHGTITLRGNLAGRPYAQTLDVALPDTSSDNAAVASLWARERIATLTRATHERPDDHDLDESITRLALEHHLMSQHTSFVAVDERPGPGDGRPSRVDQPAEAPEGVDLQSAGGVVVGAPAQRGIFAALPSTRGVGDAFGSGGLGVSGTGWGGGGSGEGTIGLGNVGTMGRGRGAGYGSGYGGGLRPASSALPRVRPAAPEVLGMLSPEVIRRIVLRNIAQVHRCYEQRLAGNPSLAGRVAVRFIVGPTGAVLGAAVASSTLADAAVGACVVAAMQRWLFPSPPGGGTVTITYPFNFTPGDAPAPSPSRAPVVTIPALPPSTRR